MECKIAFSAHRSLENIQAGIGIQAGGLIRDVSTFLVGIVWAFFINWKLAAVSIAILPTNALAISLTFRVSLVSYHTFYKEELCTTAPIGSLHISLQVSYQTTNLHILPLQPSSIRSYI